MNLPVRELKAAQRLTSTIPIIMTSASDPVGTGLVASLAQPGGNTTGTSIVSWSFLESGLSWSGKCFQSGPASLF